MAKDTTPAAPAPPADHGQPAPAGRRIPFPAELSAVATAKSTEVEAAEVVKVPREPPPTPWVFPPADRASADGIVAVGADLEPGTLLAAYRSGIFPMPVPTDPGTDPDTDPDTDAGTDAGDGDVLAWWSPDPRAVLPLDGLRVSRSLRRSCRRYRTTVDTAFAEVIAECAHERRDGRWITPEIEAAYTRLHELGWVHSVEAWAPDGELAGGLYGVAVGGLFAGESMFHRRGDASKVAVVALVGRLRAAGAVLLDVQWATPHLRSLGAVEIPRSHYLTLVAGAVTRGDSGRAWERQWRHA